MENRKININRTKISTQEIKNRQDFNQLVSVIKHPPNPFWKSLGFWGTTGLASLAVFFVTKLFLNNVNENNAYENKTTLSINESTDNLPEDTDCITPHFDTVDVPFETFEVQAGVSQTLELQDGSVIHIPEGALLAELGSKVTIKTRVFQDKSSAFIAGIPMDFQGAAFESAGMIEIRGEQNGKSVSINPDEPIDIALSLYKDPSTFNFYALNDKSGEWETYPYNYQGSVDERAKAENQSPLSVIQQDLVEIESDVNEVDLKIKNIAPPKKEDFNLPKDKKRSFKIDYLKSEFPELEAMGDVSFEALADQKNYQEVLSHTWNNFDLKTLSENTFLVTFSNSQRKVKIKVRPVLEGAELKEALVKYDAAKAQKVKEEEQLKLQKKNLEEQRKAKQAEIDAEIEKRNEQSINGIEEFGKESVASAAFKTRAALNANYSSFRARRFGVFNCDKPIAYPKPYNKQVEFIAASKNPKRIKHAYVFNESKDVRYSYGASNRNPMHQFGLGRGDNIVVVIYENGDLAYGTTSKRELSSNNDKLRLEIIEQAELDEDKIKEILREERVSA